MKISMKTFYTMSIIVLLTFVLSSCSEDVIPSTSKSKIRVVHSGYDAPSVNTSVNGISTNVNTTYRTTSIYTEVSSGNRVVKVIAPSMSNAELVNQEFTFNEFKDYSLFLTGPIANGKVETAFVYDDRSIISGKAKIRFAQMSSDASTVDVKNGSETGTTLFSAVGYKSVSNYTEINPGNISLVLTPSGSMTATNSFNPVQFEAGKVYTIVSTGTLNPNDNYPYSVRIFMDLDPGNSFVDLTSVVTAEVMVIHASPDAPAVDLIVNGIKVTTSPLTFSNSLSYIKVPVGNGNPTLALQVENSGTTIPVPANLLPTLQSGKKYTVFVNGRVSNATLGFKVLEDNFTVDQSKPIIRLAHMSPDVSAIDIILTIPGIGDSEIPSFQNIMYTGTTNFVGGTSGSYPMKVRQSGTSNILFTAPSITFQNGKVFTVLVYGMENGTPALGASIVAHN